VVDRYPVRKPGSEFCAQVNGNGRQFYSWLIPIRRVLFASQLGRCLQRKGKSVSPTKQTEAKNNVPRRKKRGWCQQDRPVIEPNAAGIDVGAREMYVAIPPDRDPDPVRVFKTFTADFEALIDWLVERGITTVAMEATGVYWIPLYQMLEDRGVRACLVNARHMKNVPGRRTDWHECQWIQYLHATGLLRPAFRPEQDVCAVRTLLRHRNELVRLAAQHVQHMQKSLTQMNVHIHHVISDITGLTGLAIVDAILAGERNVATLAELRHRSIQADEETIRKSLEGDWRPEHLFTLNQSRQMYANCRINIEACDQKIAEVLGAFEPQVDIAAQPLPPETGPSRKRRTKRTGDFGFEVRAEAYRLFGVDVTRIPGLNGLAIPLFSEVGRDLASRFPTADHFASWLALCPDNDKSGGQVLWTGVRKINNKAAQMFRMGASSLHHSHSPLGDFLRRMKAKLGPAAGITATAHKIAIIFYTLVTKQVEYDDSIWAKRDDQRQKRYEAKLKRQARRLGYQLVPVEPI
jgi:transposase